MGKVSRVMPVPGAAETDVFATFFEGCEQFSRAYMEEMILVVHNSIVLIFKLQDDYVTMDFQFLT